MTRRAARRPMVAMPADSYFVHLAERLAEQAGRMRARHLRDLGLGDLAPSHGEILFSLAREDRLTVTELARKIRRKKSTVSVLVQKLEERGLVERVAHATDRRVSLVALTARGRRLKRPLIAGFERVQRAFAGGLSPREQRTLAELLERSLAAAGTETE